MREQQISSMGPGINEDLALFRSTSRPGQPDPVRRRQREALTSLHQAWSAGQPVASEKRPGVLAKALGFLNNLW